MPGVIVRAHHRGFALKSLIAFAFFSGSGLLQVAFVVFVRAQESTVQGLGCQGFRYGEHRTVEQTCSSLQEVPTRHIDLCVYSLQTGRHARMRRCVGGVRSYLVEAF